MIDKTAIIDVKSRINKDVKIGPYTVIGPGVEIEEGTIIQSHVSITGQTKIGKNNKIYPFASIGNDPQDLKYKGEKTDLIIPISLWVLKTACLQNKAWQKRGFSPIPIAVNLSPKQFQQPNLVDIVAQVLEDTALEPHLLDLEITETAMMQNIDSKIKQEMFLKIGLLQIP